MVDNVKTEYAMTLEGEIGEPTPINNRLIFNVLRGTFDGPGISGEMQQPAGDWIQIMPNGYWRLDVRFTIKLDDGYPAYVNYSGVVHMDENFQSRIAAGETITGDEIYFRSAPYIETNSEKYAWLNEYVFIGKLRTFGGGKVVYDIFKVL
ncbi:Uncharacterised protein [Zhongshania aliphaticivorans]|uniref:Uncharacterized protein n=1 Tax=Zhongshania aliphaticivorans TaxID=1470434 RepID=A0A5S9QKW9_9GAMM|nr:DUF3237 domain-containing protein [Zhongshania aliphaticivorans]CAA0111127.1 Uncharacterised protein [Zhongshania aliphaticivorans]CAA0118466.1 Uncharacterised protein [Zhongshania aliphaticivorans]